ncbi:aminotransferase class I/II-fold pyridoxal phosphate-dependent enzyme [Candidatus Peregrinibacteria bacterium]|nr:aminotransferase class I/II-fold pyridoxal phosphate-dependent enzyme [Candidatus Peregrinibacteria bacterium]
MLLARSDRLQNIKPYAFAEINKKVAALKKAAQKGTAKSPIDFGVGDPTEPTPDFVIQNLQKFGEKHARTGYPFYTGNQNFREAAVEYMKRRFQVELDPETEICSSIGSKESVFNFPLAFLNPGDIVICPSPGYPPYKTGTILAGGEPYFVPLLAHNKFLINYESIPEEICQKAKIIWINYPNSPTGAIAERTYYQALIAWAKKHDIIIAADEGCYIDIYFEKKPISILEVAREGIVAFYSLSKRNNMTGYRVGFMCGDARIISIYKNLKTHIDSGTPSIMQEAGILALKDDDHVESMRKMYFKKRNILTKALRNMRLDVAEPDATFYIWQKVPSGMSDVEFAEKLLDPNIAIVVTPGSLISDECTGGVNPGNGYVRFALMPTMEEIEEATERLKVL